MICGKFSLIGCIQFTKNKCFESIYVLLTSYSCGKLYYNNNVIMVIDTLNFEFLVVISDGQRLLSARDIRNCQRSSLIRSFSINTETY